MFIWNSPKCKSCMWFRSTYDQSSEGGGCDNVVQCDIRSSVESMAREVSGFITNKEDFGNSATGATSDIVAEHEFDSVPVALLSKDVREAIAEVTDIEIADPVAGAIFDYLDTLPVIRHYPKLDRLPVRPVFTTRAKSFTGVETRYTERELLDNMLWKLHGKGKEAFIARKSDGKWRLTIKTGCHHYKRIDRTAVEVRDEYWPQIPEASRDKTSFTGKNPQASRSLDRHLEREAAKAQFDLSIQTGLQHVA